MFLSCKDVETGIYCQYAWKLEVLYMQTGLTGRIKKGNAELSTSDFCHFLCLEVNVGIYEA